MADNTINISDDEKDRAHRKELKKKDSGKARKDKGYKMFEEEDSEEEPIITDDIRSPAKMKKHSKPSFKFAKKEKYFKKEKEEKKEKEFKREEKKKEEKKEFKKEEKKKEEKEAKERMKIIKDKKKTRSDAGETDNSAHQIFGVPLSVAVEKSRCYDGIPLPAIFRECIDFVEEFGLACEGIYRISGVKSKVQTLKDCYNHSEPVYLQEHEPNVVASLLKLYLRDLPEPVLTKQLTPKFEEASTLKNVKQKVETFQKLIEDLPPCSRYLLSWTIVHMTHVIAKEKQNKMSLQNVSIVLSPTMQISHRVLNVLFTYSKILFRDVVIKKYIPPLRPVTSRWSLDLPDSPASLEEELKKQESLLAKLHEELMSVKDVDKEEQVWEVQRVVTQLKRKLKLVKKQSEVVVKGKEAQETEKHKPMKIDRKQLQLKQQQETLHKPKQNQPFRRQILLPLVPQKVPIASANVKVEDKEANPEEKTNEIVFRSVEELEEQLKEVELETKNEAKKSEDKDEVSEVSESDKPPSVEHEDVAPNTKNTDIEESAEKEESQTVDEQISEKSREEVEEETADEADVSKQDLSEENTLEAISDEEEDEISDDILGISKTEEQLEEAQTDQVADKTDEERASLEEDEEEEGDEEEEEISEEEKTRLLLQEAELLLEEEELLAIRDELNKKIETEQNEIERLHQEIADVRTIRDDVYTDSSESESSEGSEEEWELEEILTNLRQENGQLERENQELCEKVHQERQICLEVKVQIRMIQQGHLDNAAGVDEEKEGILVQL